MTPASAKIADPCEWNPEEGRPSLVDEEGHAEAEVLVGSRGSNWRLCRACASLPEFKRKRARKDL